MDSRYNLDQLFQEEPLKEKPIVTQEKIKVQEEEDSSLVQEEATEENEINLDLEEKEVESKSTLEVILPIVSQTPSHAFHRPNWGN